MKTPAEYAAEISERLIAAEPHLATFPDAIDLLAKTLGEIAYVEHWLDEVQPEGRFGPDGGPSSAYLLLDRLRQRATRMLSRLGLDPVAYSVVRKNLAEAARADAAAGGDALAALVAEGRKALR